MLEVVRLRVQVRELGDDKRTLSTERETLTLRTTAMSFAGREELVSRFQFVADYHTASEANGLCRVVQIGRSSYYAC